MKTLMIEFDEPNVELWKVLPPDVRQRLTEKALNAILNGDPYPTGPDQLDLAIDLAEAGVAADTISRLARLDKSIFEGFMR